MIKTIALIRRKPGMSREEFIRHYEDVHAPLAMACLPGLKGYVRNFVVTPPGGPEPDFDVVSEFWFEDAAALQAVRAFLRTEAARELREDEARFIDSASIRACAVEEHGCSRLDAGDDPS